MKSYNKTDRQIAVEKIIDELEESGILSYEEDELTKEAGKLDGTFLMEIFSVSTGNNACDEVSIVTNMIGAKNLTCKQASVICKRFKYSNIHAKPFLTNVMFNISDPENIGDLARSVLEPYEVSGFLEMFELVTGSVYQEPTTISGAITTNKKLNLDETAALIYMRVMVLIIVILIGIIIL